MIGTKTEEDKSELNFIYSILDNKINIDNGLYEMQLSLMSSKMIRVRYAHKDGFGRDFSYAVDKEKLNVSDVSFKTKDDESHLIINTNDLIIYIKKQDLKVKIENANHATILEDVLPLVHNEDYEQGIHTITLSRKIQNGEHFYGLGDKSEQADLRDKTFVIWGKDQYGFYKHTDPLYKNIPFYIGLHQGMSYGVFMDNTFRQEYDFGNEFHNICTTKTDGGEINYYFFYGPEMMDVCRQYTLLTGVPELPPLWALGYHQCKWSYYPDEKVMEICNTLRSKQIPCDVIYLDIDYMDGFRCFTWHSERFPNPTSLISTLNAMGFKVVVMIDPGIKIDKSYFVYKEGIAGNHFCHKGEGGLIKGKVWPGECHFPDFTREATRTWWASLFKGLIAENGVNGIWTDMNEPALFDVPNKTFPNDARHDYDGESCSHKKAHNVYGMLMAKASYEGVKKYNTEQRPFLITRSTYSGGQKYSSVWTGDNIASWDHLSIANVMTQRLSISGFSFCGSDIGGFIDTPSPELYIRWMQLAIMHPFFRTHSSGDHGDQEPWSFGEEAEEIVKKFIQLRYRFLPYIYSVFYEYVKYGSPMLRPLYVTDQHDMHTHYRGDEVMHGDLVFYAPIHEEDAQSKSIYFPKGHWYDYFTEIEYVGGKELIIDFPLDRSPLFIKAGAVLPQAISMNFVGEREAEILDLYIYYKNEGIQTSFLYEDAGEGYDYKDGYYNEKFFEYKAGMASIAITQKGQINYEVKYEKYGCRLIGFPAYMKKIIIDGHEKEYKRDEILEIGRDFLKIEFIL